MSRNPGYPQTDLAQLQKDSIASDERTVKKKYEITVVTPMFGGGFDPGKVDENRPVRESAIRGQLRFWWRATRGAACANACELREKEAKIFGDTSRPSNVKVKVELLSKNKPVTYMPGDKDNKLIPLYLFQRPHDHKSADAALSYITTCTFNLYLEWSAKIQLLKKTSPSDFKELDLDLKAALWAWINFGGIGARTRRGCGSLYCKDFSPAQSDCTQSNFSRWLDHCVTEYGLALPPASNPREWPTLNPNMLLTFTVKTNIFICKDIIDKYKNFRRRATKNEFYDKTKGKTYKKAGRSYWPEADSIRNILDMAHPKHDKPTHFFRSNPKKEVIAFPRAELGMPIVFQFKTVNDPPEQHMGKRVLQKKNHIEPHKTQLTPAGKERLASPLILKPLAFNINCGVGLIATLNHPPIEMLTLKILEGEKRDDLPVKMNSDPLDYTNSPMKDKEGNIHHSAIDAFLNSEKVKAFCRITSRANT